NARLGGSIPSLAIVLMVKELPITRPRSQNIERINAICNCHICLSSMILFWNHFLIQDLAILRHEYRY
ncbi:MAG TPA: hypothetical protein VN939_04570, partial [Chthoniobacterales bacterium]|nr:hypothetical protein [Chthoniobacterales bacterium]